MIATWQDEFEEARKAGLSIEILTELYKNNNHAFEERAKEKDESKEEEKEEEKAEEKVVENVVEKVVVKEEVKEEVREEVKEEVKEKKKGEKIAKDKVKVKKRVKEKVEEKVVKRVKRKVAKKVKKVEEELVELEKEKEEVKPQYNLRSARPIKQFEPKSPSITESPILLQRRLSLFAPVDVDTYHPIHLRTEQDQKIIDMASSCNPAQVASYVYNSRCFIVTSWLTALRIFQYEANINQYIETKRLPKRYVEIEPNLVTAIHHCDSKLYVAYLHGSEEEGSDCNKPYLDVLDLDGNRVKKRQYYDSIVQLIYSDKDYIYVKTNSTSIYIHIKDLFNCIRYKIDFKVYGHIINSWIERPTFNIKTTLPFVIARPKDILLTKWDYLNGQKITCCFRFNESYSTVSCFKIDDLFIFHRILEKENESNNIKSTIECGFTVFKKDNPDPAYANEIRLSFKYTLIQILPVKEFLFIFGFTTRVDGSRHYEVGSIYLPYLKPLWTTQVSNVDEKCHILAQDDHIVIIKERQQLAFFKFSNQAKCEKCKFNLVSEIDNTWHLESKHDSIFSDYQIYRNVYMETVGASIFKKIA